MPQIMEAYQTLKTCLLLRDLEIPVEMVCIQGPSVLLAKYEVSALLAHELLQKRFQHWIDGNVSLLPGLGRLRESVPCKVAAHDELTANQVDSIPLQRAELDVIKFGDVGRDEWRRILDETSGVSIMLSTVAAWNSNEKDPRLHGLRVYRFQQAIQKCSCPPSKP